MGSSSPKLRGEISKNLWVATTQSSHASHLILTTFTQELTEGVQGLEPSPKNSRRFFLPQQTETFNQQKRQQNVKTCKKTKKTHHWLKKREGACTLKFDLKQKLKIIA